MRHGCQYAGLRTVKICHRLAQSSQPIGTPSAAGPCRAIGQSTRSIFGPEAVITGNQRWFSTRTNSANCSALRCVTGVPASIGFIDAARSLQCMWPLAPGFKVEGISGEVVDGSVVLTMVTDADDPEVPSQLLSATLTLTLP